MPGAPAADPLPADLEALAADFVAIERDAEALVGPLDDDQFNWSPRPRAWSIAQCFAHLNSINAIYMEPIERAAAEARLAGRMRREPIRCSIPGRVFIALLEPPVRVRMAAPTRTVPPAARRHKAAVWPDFVRFHAHARSALASMADVDLNRATFGNPFLGRVVRMRAGTALRIIAAHERRHVWQAWRVRESAGFPR